MDYSGVYPSSSKVYVRGNLYSDVNVGMRKVAIKTERLSFLYTIQAGPTLTARPSWISNLAYES